MSVKTFITAEQVKKDTSFSDTDLDTPMMQQASLFAHYSHLAALAAKQVDDLKLRQSIVESKLDKELRDEAAASGTKITESQLGKDIMRKREFVEVSMMVNEAKMIEGLIKGACEALRQKRDMLIQIGVGRREEMKGDLVIRAAEAAAAGTSSRAKDLADRAAQR